MRTRLRSKVTLLFIVVAVLVAVPVVVAFADNLQDSITTSQQKKSIATGTANTWTNNYTVDNTGTGSDIGPGNCDIPTTGSATFKLNVPSELTVTSPDGTNLDGSPKLDFTACGTPKPVTFSSNTPGVYNISASYVSGTGGVTDGFNESPADLELTVVAAPTVTSFTPTPDGKTGVAVTDDVTATFSEAMDTSKFTTSTFKLVKDETTTPLNAAYTYNSTTNTATLNPSANLDPGTKYNVTVVSGANGVKTPEQTQSGGVVVAGGYTLEQDKTWSFTTFNPNTAPVADGQSVSTNEDNAKTITLTGSDVDGNNLTFLKVSGQDPINGTLGDIGSVTCTNTTPAPKKICSADVTYTPNQNFNGTDSFKFRVNDGTVNSATDATVSITVNAVNDAPSFTKGGDQTVLEDSGAKTVDPWASAISAGPNESGQVSFVVTTNNNTALFSTQPSVDSDGVLTFTPAANAFGNATIKVKATDNGGTANGGVDTSAVQTFTIDVNYNWNGFFQPIDNNPNQSGDPTMATVYNSAKAGQAIPVKFSLSGDKGLSIFATTNDAGAATSYPRSVKVQCPDSTDTVDPIETYSASTAAGLHYDPIAGQYIYNWKTASSLANTCQMLDLKLTDGTHHYAFFKFTK